MNRFLKIFLLSMNMFIIVMVNATVSDTNRGAFFPIERDAGQQDGVCFVEQNLLPEIAVADSSSDEELGSRSENLSRVWLEKRAEKDVRRSLRRSIKLSQKIKKEVEESVVKEKAKEEKMRNGEQRMLLKTKAGTLAAETERVSKKIKAMKKEEVEEEALEGEVPLSVH